jgi:plastocyanin
VRTSPPTPPRAPTATAAPQTPRPTAPPGSPGAGNTVEVKLQDPGGSGKYQFAPAQFNFKVGDRVTFRLTAESEFHTFTADEIGIDVAVDPGATVTEEHTFDKAGTFKLICIPHESLGMVGEIRVQ